MTKYDNKILILFHIFSFTFNLSVLPVLQLVLVLCLFQKNKRKYGGFDWLFSRVGTIQVLNNAVLVLADVVDLYQNVLRQIALSVLNEALGRRSMKNISTKYLIKAGKFILKNNCFTLKKQNIPPNSRDSFSTKFITTYIWIYIDVLQKIFFRNTIATISIVVYLNWPYCF